ncbi:MAG: amidohydrolase [Pseudomonadota bacterium]
MRHSSFWGWIAAMLFLTALIISLSILSTEPDRRAILNAKVLSMDADNTIHQAVLIDHGRIVAVGSNEEISEQIDKYTEVSDVNGKVLMPGIIDAHGHYPGSGLLDLTVDLNSPPIGKTESIADIRASLSLAAKNKGDDEWLFGWGYDDTLLAERRHPNRFDLDRISTDQPIFIVHVSGHMGVANSKALAIAGISAETTQPEGGVITIDPETGEATGLLEENAMKPVQSIAMDLGALDFLNMLSFASNQYAQRGVTTAQSGGVDARMYAGLRWASKLGLMKQRLVVFPLFDQLGPRLLAEPEEFSAHNTDNFLVGPVKIIADGSIQGYTGYLSEPYHVPYKGDADYRGYPRVSLEQLTLEVDRYRRRGIQLAIHGNGDASMDDIITAVDKAQRKYPDDDQRLILIHAQMARADQLDEFKRLGITPSFFSAHTYYWGDRHRDIFMGPKRAANMSPARWSMDRELTFSIHLDTPVVPMQPFLLVWSAVNRLSSSGQVVGADQRLPIMQALRAVTIDAAWQIFQDDNRGSIEPGKWADLILLSDDPLINPAAIKDIQVLETIVGGKKVYNQ